LFLNGRTDTGVPAAVAPFRNPNGAPVAAPPPAGGAGGGTALREPVGFEKEYGHVL
jgi:pilus assembly protein CpaC